MANSHPVSVVQARLSVPTLAEELTGIGYGRVCHPRRLPRRRVRLGPIARSEWAALVTMIVRRSFAQIEAEEEP